jgi:hypothetical protein
MLQKSNLDAVGPAKCSVAGASIRVVKERMNNMETMVGWPRAADRDACPLGALACYLVWLNEIQGLNFIGTMFSDLVWLGKNGKADYDPKWRKIYLLHASDPFNPISSTTHNSDYHGIMNAGELVEENFLTLCFLNFFSTISKMKTTMLSYMQVVLLARQQSRICHGAQWYVTTQRLEFHIWRHVFIKDGSTRRRLTYIFVEAIIRQQCSQL